jgi:sigma-E factor negative regulatory protein RseA
MTESTREQLSAFLDGELPAHEAELLLRRICADDSELRREFSRYLLIGEAMRQDRGAVVSRGFAERVTRAVELEDLPATRHGPMRARPWLRPAAGVAVAAGVAAVAVLGLRVEAPGSADVAATRTAGDRGAVAAMDLQTAADARSSSYIVPTSVGRGPVVPAARLTNYVVAHSEFSSPLGRRNVLTGLLSEDARETTPDRIDDGTDSDEDHAASR